MKASLVGSYISTCNVFCNGLNHTRSDKTKPTLSVACRATRVGSERHLLRIEDPFELSHDFSRTVHYKGIDLLRKEFCRAWNVAQMWLWSSS